MTKKPFKVKIVRTDEVTLETTKSFRDFDSIEEGRAWLAMGAGLVGGDPDFEVVAYAPENLTYRRKNGIKFSLSLVYDRHGQVQGEREEEMPRC